MSVFEVTRTVSVEVDGLVGFGELEEAALAFARSAPGQLVGEVIEGLTEMLLDAVVGPRRHPTALGDQPEAPWSCTREHCGNRRGFRRRGFRSSDRRLQAACGRVGFRTAQVECLHCGRRFAPILRLLGVRPYQRRTGRRSWQARWRDPTGAQRSKNFPRRIDAERFLTTVEARELAGTYIDPRAGRIRGDSRSQARRTSDHTQQNPNGRVPVVPRDRCSQRAEMTEAATCMQPKVPPAPNRRSYDAEAAKH
ncbi:MAG: hypothetical protein GWP04_10980 [Gammaproteobacteria bacterium]|nr:hypothetical protein [Gammaproteobacteria bacterium]